jgi:hypothetical protein
MMQDNDRDLTMENAMPILKFMPSVSIVNRCGQNMLPKLATPTSLKYHRVNPASEYHHRNNSLVSSLYEILIPDAAKQAACHTIALNS